ncbi:DNA-directed RNA polymerase subunit alpha [Hydrogenothermus marinus]|uniref:DNA-directed RNA polymerase subunit alpha n=1 Tax=Hydrogenothermus marinus TaxID=133270 RepID=A0A3M0B7N5_9AQUI|nr:DNA-directed RNA polymerase subunit alpha [Hydrogenothermus marinus]RMA92464.1 DNA-directed RNA polymerase subunit alpha [Hydrogenothermus marinus]
MPYLEFITPDKIYWDEKTKTDTYGKLYVEPLERGYGITIGNALRRVLLSSLESAAITSVKIQGVSHEFATIDGVLEDVAEIILNLKEIKFKMDENLDSEFAILEVKGPTKVYAKDIKLPAGVELVNPDVYIATIDSDAELKMELKVEKGRGYVSVEDMEKPSEIGWIPIDTAFSPIRKCAFHVEPTRVGEKTDYDKLIIEIYTDGSITPDEALTKASKILIDHFTLLLSPTTRKLEVVVEEQTSSVAEQIKKDKLALAIEELDISSRAMNTLKKLGINTIGDLVKMTEEDLKEAKSIGRKTLKEIKTALADLGLELAPSPTSEKQ